MCLSTFEPMNLEPLNSSYQMEAGFIVQYITPKIAKSYEVCLRGNDRNEVTF